MKQNVGIVVLVTLGALAGFGYYYFVGCATGTCVITGNPVVSTLYGGLIGFLIAGILPIEKKQKDHSDLGDS